MKPNMIMIMADDMGYWSMGCAGNKDIQTPNLDYLASCGVRFENFFCASPVCSPARASVLTGKIPSQHGIHDWLCRGYLNYEDVSDTLKEKHKDSTASWEYTWSRNQLLDDKAIRFIEDFDTYTEILENNGYTCGLSGKWHLGDAKNPQKGFSYWKTIAMGGDNYYYPTVLKNGKFDMLRDVYITDYITENALQFLDEANGPFYLSVHYTAPHTPWDSFHHPKEFYDLYNNCAFTETPNVEPHEWAPKYTQEQRRKNLQGYYAAMSAMDKGIGDIIKRIEEKGLWEDTLILFTSDNGMSMGHHGIFGKGNGTFPLNMYDTAVKVPMIISYPKKIKGGTVNNQMFSHYDIMPTIAEWFGVSLDDTYPGRSFLHVLDSEAKEAPTQDQSAHDEIVIMDEYGPVRMIRTYDYKYVHRYPYGKNELYDLKADPGEENNLIDKPEMAEVQADLKYRLESWFLKYTDPEMDGTKMAVTGGGQRNLCGVKAKGYKDFR